MSTSDQRALSALRRASVRLAAQWVDSAAPSFTRFAVVGDKIIPIDTKADIVHLALSGAANAQLDSHRPLSGIVWC